VDINKHSKKVKAIIRNNIFHHANNFLLCKNKTVINKMENITEWRKDTLTCVNITDFFNKKTLTHISIIDNVPIMDKNRLE